MKRISSIHSPTYRHNFMWDIEQVLNYLKIYAPSSEVSLKLFIIETLLSLLTLEAVYVTIGNPAFCLTLYLTGVHF